MSSSRYARDQIDAAGLRLHSGSILRRVRRRLWTARDKWMGNLIPALAWLPFTLAGAIVLLRGKQVAAPGLALIAFGQVAAWLTLNLAGLYSNRSLRKALAKEVDVLKPHFRGFRAFVGYSSPGHSSLLDAHEDVGYLLLSPELLEFIGDSKMISVHRGQIFGVRFKPNVHTAVGLGRWISIEGRVDGRPFEMLIEPRDHDTMLGNLMLGNQLKARIDNWLKRQEPRGK